MSWPNCESKVLASNLFCGITLRCCRETCRDQELSFLTDSSQNLLHFLALLPTLCAPCISSTPCTLCRLHPGVLRYTLYTSSILFTLYTLSILYTQYTLCTHFLAIAASFGLHNFVGNSSPPAYLHFDCFCPASALLWRGRG